MSDRSPGGAMKAKILVVDDDADIVEMLKDRLEWLKFETVTASDGARGLELLEQEMPRAMLLDLQTPRMDGLDVLKRIAQGRAAKRDGYDMPVIVMTTHGTIAKAVEAMKEGAYDFL